MFLFWGGGSFCCEEYFSQHLGEYENVLAALEDLNMSILKAMDKTKKVSYWRDKPAFLNITYKATVCICNI